MPRGRPQSLRGSIRAVKDATGKVIRYEGTINLGKDETGTYRRQVLTGRTKKEVQAKLDSALDALQHAVTTKRHITALAFFDEWLRYVQANNCICQPKRGPVDRRKGSHFLPAGVIVIG